jgi:hypothetical protein
MSLFFGFSMIISYCSRFEARAENPAGVAPYMASVVTMPTDLPCPIIISLIFCVVTPNLSLTVFCPYAIAVAAAALSVVPLLLFVDMYPDQSALSCHMFAAR